MTFVIDRPGQLSRTVGRDPTPRALRRTGGAASAEKGMASMATILVTGGTGTLGQRLLPRLVARRHRVRVLGHEARPSVPSDVAVIPGDLATGAGLGDAVPGADTIIHAASSFSDPQGVDVGGTRRLLDAARASAPPPQLVYLSIVGVDRTAFPYFAAKHAAEELVRRAGLPWSILRATQFHSYAQYLIQSLGADTAAEVPVPTGARLQPIDSGDVADALVALAQLGPTGRVSEIGGPEVLTFEEMTAAYLRSRGRGATIRPDASPDEMFELFRAGLCLTPDHAVGVLTWQGFLDGRGQRGRRGTQ